MKKAFENLNKKTKHMNRISDNVGLQKKKKIK